MLVFIMPRTRQLRPSGFINSDGPQSLDYDPRCDIAYTRIDNGLYLVNRDGNLSLEHASVIHLRDQHALLHEYERTYLPHGTKLVVQQIIHCLYYSLWRGNKRLFRAVYQLKTDALTDVRTTPSERGKGYARAVLDIILRADGPSLIEVGPSEDSPVGFHKLMRFYGSFPGYHAVPGTNKVIRLMQDDNVNFEEADDHAIEEAGATDFGRRAKSHLEISVLEQNNKEYKRIMDILRPQNDEEVQRLLNAIPDDIIAARNAIQIYDSAFFEGRPWGRAHRVMFAQGLVTKLARHGLYCGAWEKIIREESI
jgi:hypothetical protein